MKPTRPFVQAQGKLYCLILTPEGDGIADWDHVTALMRELYEDRLVDPDMVIIHPNDAQVLLEMMFRAQVLQKPHPLTGIPVPVDSAAGVHTDRVGYLANVATGKIMPVSEKADATPGELVFAIQRPWQIVGILKGLKHRGLVA